MPYYSRYNAPYGALLRYGYRGIYTAYIMPVVGRSVALCAVVWV